MRKLAVLVLLVVGAAWLIRKFDRAVALRLDEAFGEPITREDLGL